MALGKKQRTAREGLDRVKLYALNEAIAMIRKGATAKFDETVEVAMNLGVDPRHADQMVRGVCQLPNGSGRTVRVAVFAKGDKADEAKAAGADIVGAEDLVEIVQKGTIDFDRCIATPDMMPLVGRLGKVLGPRGLMPNPKVGTVTPDVATAVKAAKGGAVEFRVEKAGIIHAGVGKVSFTEDALVENIRAFADAVAEGKAHRGQGDLRQEGSDFVDHGSWHPCRPGDRIGRLTRACRSAGNGWAADWPLIGAADRGPSCPRLQVPGNRLKRPRVACMRRGDRFHPSDRADRFELA